MLNYFPKPHICSHLGSAVQDDCSLYEHHDEREESVHLAELEGDNVSDWIRTESSLFAGVSNELLPLQIFSD